MTPTLRVAALAGLMAFAGHAPAQAEAASAKLFKASKPGVSLLFPKDWKVRETNMSAVWNIRGSAPADMEQANAVTAGGKVTPAMFVAPSFEVQIVQLPIKTDAMAYMKSHQQFSAAIPGFRTLKEMPFVVGGQPARRALEGYPLPLNMMGVKEADVRRVVYTAIHGKRAYKFIGMCHASVIDRHARMFNAMVKTVKFQP